MEKFIKISSEKIFSNKFLTLNQNVFRSPTTSKEAPYYVLKFTDWANIVPVTVDMEVILIKQFRVGSEDFSIEIPGGMVDEGENPKDGIIRELLEETGYKCNEVHLLNKVYANPAIQNNFVYGYLGIGAHYVEKQNLDESEEIEILKVPIKNITKMINSGEINHPYATLSLIMAINRLNISQ